MEVGTGGRGAFPGKRRSKRGGGMGAKWVRVKQVAADWVGENGGVLRCLDNDMTLCNHVVRGLHVDVEVHPPGTYCTLLPDTWYDYHTW